MIVKAYVDKSTNIHERIQSAWCVVFVCRLWLCYLQKISNFKTSANGKVIRETKKNINSYFITRPAYLSVELNAHNLLYLILLVKQKRLPKQALNSILCLIHRLASQYLEMPDR
ncbi:unnamed protein product [Rotaria socialis]|uniref:Uncharacterized protein n=1 Tax=Rotaria socialis TaxID=392032 RepID=A0A817UDS5_9BILA|nr:unnamed protein product [Rotaria socialis]CAF4553983.1 unnamed protein product [Rotaria socialis]